MKIKDLFREVKYPIELFDEKGNLIYCEFSNGHWVKREYDENDNQIYYEDSEGGWVKIEYDKNGNEVYYKDSVRVIEDNRPKVEMSIKEIEEKLGIENLKIIKETEDR